MKTLSISELNELDFDFKAWSTNSEFELHQNQTGEDEYKDHFTSWVAGYCRASAGGLEVEFSWIATGGVESYQDAHEFSIEIEPSSEFALTGFTLVDDDGDELHEYEFDEVMRDKFESGDWFELVKQELPEPETNDIDIDESSEMETFTLDIDNAPSIRFTGELVASAASSDNTASGNGYSGSAGRWTELYLYKTVGGKYICHQIGCTRWQGERARFAGEVCETVAEVIEFFGHRWLAKELYGEAGIEDVNNVE